jgi:hypothetical protein
MKIINFRKAVAAALAASGLFLSGSAAYAVTHAVGDPSFEEIGLGTLDYYYFQGPPNSPFWKKKVPGSAGNNAVYNSNFSTVTFPNAPDPRTGNQAIDGEGAYNYQILDETFVAGRTYTYTAYTQGWLGNTADNLDRFWMYFFAGTGGEGGDPPANMDDDSLVRVTFHQDGTLNAGDPVGDGTGAKGVLPFSGFIRSADAEWTLVGLTYTATAADEGKRIGLGIWANELGAFDDVALTSVTLLGDYDENGTVGSEDFDLWKSTFGDAIAPGGGADGNRNGIVDAADYTVWRDHVTPLVGAAIPEPGTLLLGLAAAGFAPRRRKAGHGSRNAAGCKSSTF